jgi:uncharacterized membrane protein
MIASLISALRPLLHPMLVHFPIALLFASVALDWIGFWLGHAGLTRAGFYTLVLGAMGAGVAALSGPDHATGGPAVTSLLVSHQSYALITVSLAISLMAVRFFAADGIAGPWALGYLACTLALVTVVSFTGYYGGELVYHQAVGVTLPAGAVVPTGGASGGPLVPVKPAVALLGLLCIVGLGLWLAAGRTLAPRYYATWWQAVRQDRASGGAIWTLRMRSTRPVGLRGVAAAPRPGGDRQLGPRHERGAASSGTRG